MNVFRLLNSIVYNNEQYHKIPELLKISGVKKNIGIIDADLLEKRNHRFPNLCCMKISGFHKEIGNNVKLVLDWNESTQYDIVYISKVFTETNVPEWILKLPNAIYGGTGFFFDNAPPLPDIIEHHMPDYNLYDEWITIMIDKGFNESEFKYYKRYSIGFLTRHCFNGCEFCINRSFKKVDFHAQVKEFLNDERPYILLLDDQFLGYKNWDLLLDELEATNKAFQFKQGLDIRQLTEHKAERLSKVRYHGDYIFAFDDIKDELIIRNKLKLWRKYSRSSRRRTKLYTFCAFDKNNKYDTEFWLNDIVNLFRRIFILAEYDCTAYVMRYHKYKDSPFRGIYTNIATMCNQPWILRTMSFREFSIRKGMGDLYSKYRGNIIDFLKDNHSKGATWLYMDEFERLYPEVSKMFFDINFKSVQSKVV